MDDYFNRILLALRRFIGVPIPQTDLRLHGLLATNSRIRVLLSADNLNQQAIDLPLYHAGGPERLPPWWYVIAVRNVATWMTQEKKAAGRPETIEASFLFARGIISDDCTPSFDDALDFVIADLAADPLWHGASASVAPEVYVLAGFRLLNQTSVRVYVHYDTRMIGIDLSVTEARSNTPRSPGWWASTKVVAILRDEATLAAHQVATHDDPCCDAVYDLRRWA